MRTESFSWVEDPYVRKNTNLEPISVPTLMKYLERLGKAVERKLRALIPDKFGIVFDAWTMGTEHYVALFLVWSSLDNAVHERLISCGVQEELEADGDETTFTAEDLGDYIFDELDLLGRTDVRARVMASTIQNATEAAKLDNPFDVVGGDNTNTNPKLARLLGAPFKGCDAHKENLEVTEFVGPKAKRARGDVESNDNESDESLTKRRKLVMKTDKLMVSLTTLKNSSKLRRVNKLKAKRINGVRWAAQLGTMIRESEIREDLPQANFPRDVRALFLTPVEQSDADELVKDLKMFEKVSKALQGQGKSKQSPRLTVSQSRNLLNKLIDKFPDHNFTKINEDSPLVTHPVWESAICKLQNGQEDRLTAAEKREVKRYLLPDASADDDIDEDDDEFCVANIVAAQHKEVSSRMKKSRYRSTNHIPTTSVIVECLFSRAKIILAERRRSMSPWHMELLLFLYCNRDLWDATTVNSCMVPGEDFWSDDEEDPAED